MVFHITLEQAEDGWIVAECPSLPGCVSQGKDEAEAIENGRIPRVTLILKKGGFRS
jgi:predicted RNase H-like HicB family nuclease